MKLGLQKRRGRKERQRDLGVDSVLGVLSYGAIPTIEVVKILNALLDHLSRLISELDNTRLTFAGSCDST